MSALKAKVKKNLVAGLIALLPLWLTLYLSWIFLRWFGGIFGGLLVRLPALQRFPYVVNLFLGFCLLAGLIMLTGLLASNLFGKRFLAWGESVVSHVPVVRRIYGATRQFTDMFLLTRAAFRKVVLVEFPRRGIYAVGFLTSDARWRLTDGVEGQGVFIPSTPNPSTGWLIIAPKNEILSTDLTVEAGIKLIVSGGIVSPEVCGIVPDGPGA